MWQGPGRGTVPAGPSTLLGCHNGTQRRVPPGEAAAGPGGGTRGELSGVDTRPARGTGLLRGGLGTIHLILPHRKWRTRLPTVAHLASESSWCRPSSRGSRCFRDTGETPGTPHSARPQLQDHIPGRSPKPNSPPPMRPSTADHDPSDPAFMASASNIETSALYLSCCQVPGTTTWGTPPVSRLTLASGSATQAPACRFLIPSLSQACEHLPSRRAPAHPCF